jgi:hypothetical protein
MLESQLITRIEKAIKRACEGCYWIKMHGSAFTRAGMPDIFIYWRNKTLAMEVKLPGKSPTRIQRVMLNRLARNGVYTGVVHSVDEAMTLLRDTFGQHFAAKRFMEN